MTPGAKRIARKREVRDWLLAFGPSPLSAIASGTNLTAAAVSRALQDIRNDPAYEYATVPTYDGGYVYQIAYTVAEMRDGLRNQAKHLLTRAESMIAAGQKATALAAAPDDYALAADVTATGRLLKMQAEAILAAVA